MAIFHLHAQVISRGKGRSAVAAAAYRAGEKMTNEYDKKEHDYSRRRVVEHTEIMLPENAPAEFKDRAFLWNAVEKKEYKKNSQLAREIEVALPHELNLEQQVELLRNYVKTNFVEEGMIADFSIHHNKGNQHGHVLLSMRPFDENGEWGEKSNMEYLLDENGERYKTDKGNWASRKINLIDWDNQENIEKWRESWAAHCNEYLAEKDKVDHRSYERQGLDIKPLPNLRMIDWHKEQRGIRTKQGDLRRKAIEERKHHETLKSQQPVVASKPVSEQSEPVAPAENVENKSKRDWTEEFKGWQEKATSRLKEEIETLEKEVEVWENNIARNKLSLEIVELKHEQGNLIKWRPKYHDMEVVIREKQAELDKINKELGGRKDDNVFKFKDALAQSKSDLAKAKKKLSRVESTSLDEYRVEKLKLEREKQPQVVETSQSDLSKGVDGMRTFQGIEKIKKNFEQHEQQTPSKPKERKHEPSL